MGNYVAVFGDQSLFNLAPYDAELVDEGMYYYKRSESNLLRFYRHRWVVTKMFKRKPIAERILENTGNFIPTNESPKRFTMRDYRNNKIPDYNATGINSMNGLKIEFLGLGKGVNEYCIRYIGGRCEIIPKQNFQPYETDVEKYEREREEIALSIIRLNSDKDERDYFRGLLDMYDYCHNNDVTTSRDDIKQVVMGAVKDGRFGFNEHYIRGDSFDCLCREIGKQKLTFIRRIEILKQLGYYPIELLGASDGRINVNTDANGRNTTRGKKTVFVNQMTQYDSRDIVKMVQNEVAS